MVAQEILDKAYVFIGSIATCTRKPKGVDELFSIHGLLISGGNVRDRRTGASDHSLQNPASRV